METQNYVWLDFFSKFIMKEYNCSPLGFIYLQKVYITVTMPCPDVASNLLAIDLHLDVRIACDSLQQKFQHAEYFTCDPFISFDFQMVFTIKLGFS